MNEDIKKASHLMRTEERTQHRVITQFIQQYTGFSKSQHLLLMMLGDENFKSQKEMAQHLHVSPAAITMSLKHLEQEGYIERTANPNDTRYNFVTLTEKGRKTIDVSVKLFETIDGALFADFSDDEIRQFSSYLERIIDNVEQLEKSGELAKLV